MPHINYRLIQKNIDALSTFYGIKKKDMGLALSQNKTLTKGRYYQIVDKFNKDLAKGNISLKSIDRLAELFKKSPKALLFTDITTLEAR